MKKHLVLYVHTNKFGRHDGNYFRQEASKYEVHHVNNGDEVHSYPLSGKLKFGDRLWKTSRTIAGAIRDHGKFDVLVFFGHGYRHGIQIGYQWKYGARLFAMNIHELGVKTVVLYACSTAKDLILRKDDNFCEWVGRELLKFRHADWKIFGHRTAGDTTRNPYLVVYEGFISPAHVPTDINVKVTPREFGMRKLEFRDIFGGQQWQVWRAMLKTERRFDFPFMGIEDRWYESVRSQKAFNPGIAVP